MATVTYLGNSGEDDGVVVDDVDVFTYDDVVDLLDRYGVDADSRQVHDLLYKLSVELHSEDVNVVMRKVLRKVASDVVFKLLKEHGMLTEDVS